MDKKAEWEDWSKSSHRARSSVRGGGARKNHRYPGQAGTWTCPDCRRTIDDNQASVQQHRRSVYCVSRQLWHGGKETDWNVCMELAAAVEKDSDLEVHNGQVWRRRQDRPKSPLHPPRQDKTRGRSCGGEKGRSASRHARNRRLRLQERSMSRDRRSRCRSRSRSRRSRAEAHTKAPAVVDGRRDKESDTKRALAAKHDRKAQKKTNTSKEKQPQAEAPKKEPKGRVKKEEESESYSYYSSSSDGQEADGDAPAEKKAAAPPASSKASSASVAKKASKPEAAAVPRDSSAGQKKGSDGAHERRLEYMNSLLKTALETMANFEKES